MFQQIWWTRRRVRWGGLAVALLAVLAWVSGTGEVYVGQPLGEAKAILWRAGAKDCSDNCGMHPQLGPGQLFGNVTRTFHQFANGHTIYIVAARDDADQPFRVERFERYRGWPKIDEGVTKPSPDGDSVTLRRSVFAFVPMWVY